MRFTIGFKKEGYDLKCHMHISDKRLHALQSLICSDIQFLSDSQECYILKWLENDHIKGEFTSGNACMVIILENEISVEDLFFDTPSIVYLEKDELIKLIKLWIQFCNNGIEASIQLNSIHF